MPFAAILLTFLIIFNCGPKPKVTTPPSPGLAPLPTPYNLKAEAGNRMATLFWSIDRSKDQAIAGYNIYLVDKISSADTATWTAKPGALYNHAPYPGDTKGDLNHQSFILDNLVNGRKYYALVRTVGIDLTESKQSPVANFIPFASGLFILIDDHSSRNGGFNLDEGMNVSAYDTLCDLYLYSTKTKTGLSSPNRLTPGMRRTKFAREQSDNFIDETIIISERQKITVKTKNGIGQLFIQQIKGGYPNISVWGSYSFYPYNNNADK
jgi:hypothetical protein